MTLQLDRVPETLRPAFVTPRPAGLVALVAALLLAPTLGILPRPAHAQLGSPNENAKIIIHVTPAVGRGCSSTKARARCDEMKVNGSIGAYYYAYVCVVDGNRDTGVAGLQFGVKFNKAKRAGVDITEWTNCAVLQFPSPPGKADWYNASTGGNLMTWDPQNSCQQSEPSGSGTGVTAVAGYFYLTSYTPDRLEITPRPNDNIASVSDCASSISEIVGPVAPFHTTSYLGFVEFSDGGTVAGFNPCGLARPIIESTWTGVKNVGR